MGKYIFLQYNMFFALMHVIHHLSLDVLSYSSVCSPVDVINMQEKLP